MYSGCNYNLWSHQERTFLLVQKIFIFISKQCNLSDIFGKGVIYCNLAEIICRKRKFAIWPKIFGEKCVFMATCLKYLVKGRFYFNLFKKVGFIATCLGYLVECL